MQPFLLLLCLKKWSIVFTSSYLKKTIHWFMGIETGPYQSTMPVDLITIRDSSSIGWKETKALEMCSPASLAAGGAGVLLQHHNVMKVIGCSSPTELDQCRSIICAAAAGVLMAVAHLWIRKGQSSLTAVTAV